jgi:hypothetical protein
MADNTYAYTLAERVFGNNSAAWLDEFNPRLQSTPRSALNHCEGCAASVVRLLQRESARQAAVRAIAAVRDRG